MHQVHKLPKNRWLFFVVCLRSSDEKRRMIPASLQPPIELDEFLASVRRIIGRHELDRPGRYRRWNHQDDSGSRDLGINPYGCADAANLLYTLGDFPGDPEVRDCWIETLQSFQDAETGYFREATHHDIHCTAHCLASLELFDAKARHQVTALFPLLDGNALEAFMDGLNWRSEPWSASHQGAGAYVCLVLSGQADRHWEDRYFQWLWEESDPLTGFLRRGCVQELQFGNFQTLFPHLAGTFHYLFNLEAARRPLRYPTRLIDSCLELRRSDPFPLGTRIGFAEVDWVYCLTRALRQSGHRFEESRAALASFAREYFSHVMSLDPETDDGLNDLHQLFGCLCALAELQQSVPGLIRTARPLRLVLDRRPFI